MLVLKKDEEKKSQKNQSIMDHKRRKIVEKIK